MPRASLSSLRRAARNPRMVVRVVLGLLLAANLGAALFVLKPWAGSASDLERQAASLRRDLRQRQAAIERLRGIVGKVETARGDGDRFMDTYLLGRRTLASALVLELDQTARQAGIKQKDISYGFEPIEGSDSLSKAIITASYEGTYADLIHFLNLLDRSSRLLIIESLAAAPQQNGMTLSVTMKLNGFVREGSAAPVEVASAGGAGK
jgi:Tfp pilus assembly protein PilO